MKGGLTVKRMLLEGAGAKSTAFFNNIKMILCDIKTGSIVGLLPIIYLVLSWQNWIGYTAEYTPPIVLEKCVCGVRGNHQNFD